GAPARRTRGSSRPRPQLRPPAPPRRRPARATRAPRPPARAAAPALRAAGPPAAMSPADAKRGPRRRKSKRGGGGKAGPAAALRGSQAAGLAAPGGAAAANGPLGAGAGAGAGGAAPGGYFERGRGGADSRAARTCRRTCAARAPGGGAGGAGGGRGRAARPGPPRGLSHARRRPSGQRARAGVAAAGGREPRPARLLGREWGVAGGSGPFRRATVWGRRRPDRRLEGPTDALPRAAGRSSRAGGAAPACFGASSRGSVSAWKVFLQLSERGRVPAVVSSLGHLAWHGSRSGNSVCPRSGRALRLPRPAWPGTSLSRQPGSPAEGSDAAVQVPSRSRARALGLVRRARGSLPLQRKEEMRPAQGPPPAARGYTERGAAPHRRVLSGKSPPGAASVSQHLRFLSILLGVLRASGRHPPATLPFRAGREPLSEERGLQDRRQLEVGTLCVCVCVRMLQGAHSRPWRTLWPVPEAVSLGGTLERRCASRQAPQSRDALGCTPCMCVSVPRPPPGALWISSAFRGGCWARARPDLSQHVECLLSAALGRPPHRCSSLVTSRESAPSSLGWLVCVTGHGSSQVGATQCLRPLALPGSASLRHPATPTPLSLLSLRGLALRAHPVAARQPLRSHLPASPGSAPCSLRAWRLRGRRTQTGMVLVRAESPAGPGTRSESLERIVAPRPRKFTLRSRASGVVSESPARGDAPAAGGPVPDENRPVRPYPRPSSDAPPCGRLFHLPPEQPSQWSLKGAPPCQALALPSALLPLSLLHPALVVRTFLGSLPPSLAWCVLALLATLCLRSASGARSPHLVSCALQRRGGFRQLEARRAGQRTQPWRVLAGMLVEAWPGLAGGASGGGRVLVLSVRPPVTPAALRPGDAGASPCGPCRATGPLQRASAAKSLVLGPLLRGVPLRSGGNPRGVSSALSPAAEGTPAGLHTAVGLTSRNDFGATAQRLLPVSGPEGQRPAPCAARAQQRTRGDSDSKIRCAGDPLWHGGSGPQLPRLLFAGPCLGALVCAAEQRRARVPGERPASAWMQLPQRRLGQCLQGRQCRVGPRNYARCPPGVRPESECCSREDEAACQLAFLPRRRPAGGCLAVSESTSSVPAPAEASVLAPSLLVLVLKVGVASSVGSPPSGRACPPRMRSTLVPLPLGADQAGAVGCRVTWRRLWVARECGGQSVQERSRPGWGGGAVVLQGVARRGCGAGSRGGLTPDAEGAEQPCGEIVMDAPRRAAGPAGWAASSGRKAARGRASVTEHRPQLSLWRLPVASAVSAEGPPGRGGGLWSPASSHMLWPWGGAEAPLQPAGTHRGPGPEDCLPGSGRGARAMALVCSPEEGGPGTRCQVLDRGAGDSGPGEQRETVSLTGPWPSGRAVAEAAVVAAGPGEGGAQPTQAGGRAGRRARLTGLSSAGPPGRGPTEGWTVMAQLSCPTLRLRSPHRPCSSLLGCDSDISLRGIRPGARRLASVLLPLCEAQAGTWPPPGSCGSRARLCSLSESFSSFLCTFIPEAAVPCPAAWLPSCSLSGLPELASDPNGIAPFLLNNTGSQSCGWLSPAWPTPQVLTRGAAGPSRSSVGRARAGRGLLPGPGLPGPGGRWQDCGCGQEQGRVRPPLCGRSWPQAVRAILRASSRLLGRGGSSVLASEVLGPAVTEAPSAREGAGSRHVRESSRRGSAVCVFVVSPGPRGWAGRDAARAAPALGLCFVEPVVQPAGWHRLARASPGGAGLAPGDPRRGTPSPWGPAHTSRLGQARWGRGAWAGATRGCGLSVAAWLPRCRQQGLVLGSPDPACRTPAVRGAGPAASGSPGRGEGPEGRFDPTGPWGPSESLGRPQGPSGSRLPPQPAQRPALPCPALPCPALPCPALPCPALPCPCPALPCPALPSPALPCPALAPAPALPCPALPCPCPRLGGPCRREGGHPEERAVGVLAASGARRLRVQDPPSVREEAAWGECVAAVHCAGQRGVPCVPPTPRPRPAAGVTATGSRRSAPVGGPGPRWRGPVPPGSPLPPPRTGYRRSLEARGPRCGGWQARWGLCREPEAQAGGESRSGVLVCRVGAAGGEAPRGPSRLWQGGLRRPGRRRLLCGRLRAALPPALRSRLRPGRESVCVWRLECLGALSPARVGACRGLAALSRPQALGGWGPRQRHTQGLPAAGHPCQAARPARPTSPAGRTRDVRSPGPLSVAGWAPAGTSALRPAVLRRPPRAAEGAGTWAQRLGVAGPGWAVSACAAAPGRPGTGQVVRRLRGAPGASARPESGVSPGPKDLLLGSPVSALREGRVLGPRRRVAAPFSFGLSHRAPPYPAGDCCLLCRSERKDPAGPESGVRAAGKLALSSAAKAGSALHLPLWVCPGCRRTVGKEEQPGGLDPPTTSFSTPLWAALSRRPAGGWRSGRPHCPQPARAAPRTRPARVRPAASGGECRPGAAAGALGPQSAGGWGVAGPRASGQSRGLSGTAVGVLPAGRTGASRCEGGGRRPALTHCRHRESPAEPDREPQQLQNCWSEVRCTVRCIYRQAGAPRADDQDQPLVPSKEGVKALVDRLCERDPYQLYQRLEQQAREHVLEVKVRLLRQLSAASRVKAPSGPQGPPQAHRFISLLLEEYSALCQAARTISTFLGTLEDEHLKKFQVTWELHNKHLFENLVFSEPLLQSSLPALVSQIRLGSSARDACSEDAYGALLRRFQHSEEELRRVAEEWLQCQERIDAYVDEQLTGKKAVAPENNFTDAVRHALSSRLSPPDCPRCGYRRRCACDDCSLSHILTCGVVGPPADAGTDRLAEIRPPSESPASSGSGSSSPVGAPQHRRLVLTGGGCAPAFCSDDEDGAPPSARFADIYPLSSYAAEVVASMNGAHSELNGGGENLALQDERDWGAGSWALPAPADASDGRPSRSPQAGGSGGSSSEDGADGESRREPAGLLQDGSARGGGSPSQEDRGGDSPAPACPAQQAEQALNTCECHVCKQEASGLSASAMTAGALPPGHQFVSPEKPAHPALQLYPHIHGHVPLHAVPHLPRPLLHPALYTAPPFMHSKALPPAPVQNHTKQHQVFGASLQDHIYPSCFGSTPEWSSSKFLSLWGAQVADDKDWSPGTCLPDTVPGSDVLGPTLSETRPEALPPPSSNEAPADSKEKKNAAKKKCLYNFQDAFSEANKVVMATSSATSSVCCTATTVQSSNSQFKVSSKRPPSGGGVFHGTSKEDHRHAVPAAPRSSPTGLAPLPAPAPHLASLPAPTFPKAATTAPGFSEPRPSFCPGPVAPPPPTADGSASAPPSVCSDPDCGGHRCENGGYDPQQGDGDESADEDSCSEHSSSTSTSTTQKEGKYCDCCYCEFFGHGGVSAAARGRAARGRARPLHGRGPRMGACPPAAPTSRNYAEMREKLRLRLTKRKEEQPRKAAALPGRAGREDHRRVEDLLRFINSAEPKPVSSARAAKRARHRQRKQLEEKARLEAEARAREQPHLREEQRAREEEDDEEDEDEDEEQRLQDLQKLRAVKKKKKERPRKDCPKLDVLAGGLQAAAEAALRSDLPNGSPEQAEAPGAAARPPSRHADPAGPGPGADPGGSAALLPKGAGGKPQEPLSLLLDVLQPRGAGAGGPEEKPPLQGRGELAQTLAEPPRDTEARPRPEPKARADPPAPVEPRREDKDRRASSSSLRRPPNPGPAEPGPPGEPPGSTPAPTDSPQPRGRSKKSKKKKGDRASSSIDDVFLPKDIDLDSVDMDETEREVEYFKRRTAWTGREVARPGGHAGFAGRPRSGAQRRSCCWTCLAAVRAAVRRAAGVAGAVGLAPRPVRRSALGLSPPRWPGGPALLDGRLSRVCRRASVSDPDS
ncbi:LOW QUALITY PROTEIN: Protein FAM193A, partial [Galemys pyrenaicus]